MSTTQNEKDKTDNHPTQELIPKKKKIVKKKNGVNAPVTIKNKEEETETDKIQPTPCSNCEAKQGEGMPPPPPPKELNQQPSTEKRKRDVVDTHVPIQQPPPPHHHDENNRQMVLRNMDLIMYVLYSEDEMFVMDMVRKVAHEIADKFECEELRTVVKHRDKPLLYRCLFFLLLNFHKQFRYWVLTSNNSLGLKPICPYKATRFLIALKNEIIPGFLVDERVQLDEMERKIKVTYVSS